MAQQLCKWSQVYTYSKNPNKKSHYFENRLTCSLWGKSWWNLLELPQGKTEYHKATEAWSTRFMELLRTVVPRHCTFKKLSTEESKSLRKVNLKNWRFLYAEFYRGFFVSPKEAPLMNTVDSKNWPKASLHSENCQQNTSVLSCFKKVVINLRKVLF